MKVNTLKEFSEILLSEINNAEEIYLFHHLRPDGDCLGAAFGLKAVLNNHFPDKKVEVIGNNYANFLFLPMDFCTDYQAIKYEKGLAIILDCIEINRVEQSAILSNGNKLRFKTTICIDHHESSKSPPFDYYYDQEKYSATCQIIVEIIQQWNWTLTPLAATFLYLGIYTDTNRFLYDVVDTKTLLAASFCWDHGADKNLIHHQFMRQNSQSLKIKAHVLANYQQIGLVSYFYFDLSTQQQLGIVDPLNASMPQLIANIDDSLIWIFFTQETSNKIRCEFRSNGINLRPLAQSLGGGGHQRAAGVIISSSDQIPAIIAQALELTKSKLS